MATLHEKEGSAIPVENIQGSQDSENMSNKVSGEEIENVHHYTEKSDVEHAFKGDDSDGKVDWTWRQIITSISLALTYVVSSQIHIQSPSPIQKQAN